MKKRYLLYIDILGFEELVAKPERVDDLYAIVASLHALRDGSFETIVFSDTILVYNISEPQSAAIETVMVMSLCEYFKDLLHRLGDRDIASRAVLTYGDFEHYVRDKVPCFYGPALNTAYHAEKRIQCSGLFLDRHCQQHNHIFSSLPFDEEWAFTFVTQALDELEDVYGGHVPIPEMMAIETDFCWFVGPELLTLAQCARHAVSHPDERVRHKYNNTLDFYRRRYPQTFANLEPVNFDLRAVSPHFDWSKLRERLGDSYQWASEKRFPTPRNARRPR